MTLILLENCGRLLFFGAENYLEANMCPLRKHFDQKIVILKSKTSCNVVSSGRRKPFLKLLKCFVLEFMVLVFDFAWDATFFCQEHVC